MLSTTSYRTFFFSMFCLTFLQFNNGFSQTWIEKNESENYVARHEFGFVQAGDKFVMFGGRESSQRLDVYDYATNTWEQGGMAPEPFNHFQAISFEGLIWVIGAFKTNVPNPEESADYIYMYNPATQQWIQGMEIPESRKRGAAGLAVYNNKFYVVGGNNNGHSGGYVSYFDEFNPTTGAWTSLTNAPHERDHFQAAVFGDKLYAIGGRLTGGPGGLFEPQVPEVDVYNFITEQWTTLNNSQNIPNPRAGLGVIVYNNEIYTLGGETTFNRPNNGQVSIVESFNPTTNTWTTQSSLNYPRHGFQPIVSGSTLYVAGGSSGGVIIRNMEYLGTDDASGTANVNSTFAAAETTKAFEYGPDFGSVTIDIELSNTSGTTGTYIDNISITGTDYTLANTYANQLVGANSSVSIQAVLTNTTQNTRNGTVSVTYNNNSTLTIELEGTLNPTLSIDTLNETNGNLLVYPSPTKNTFSINHSVTELKLYDVSGKLIKEFSGAFKAKQDFSVSELSAGLYIVKARNSSQAQFTGRLIKK